MKYELILIFAIMFAAQIENFYDQRNLERLNLALANRTINILSNMRIERQVHIYKYRSPIAKEDFDKLTSPMGYRELLNPYTGGTRSSNHKGLDIVGTWHCLIRPIVLNGEILETWPAPDQYYKGHPIHGGYVVLKHDDGWKSNYSHLSKLYVMKGDKLIDGKFYRNGKLLPSEGAIGRQGNTGQSWNEHLHLSIQTPDDEFVDPLQYIDL